MPNTSGFCAFTNLTIRSTRTCVGSSLKCSTFQDNREKTFAIQQIYRPLSLGSWELGVGSWELAVSGWFAEGEAKRGTRPATVGAVLECERAAVTFGNLPTECEANTGATRLRRKERDEQVAG